MANASNNGLLPLNNGQANGQGGGYSQVSPMMGMYYNAAEAPTGSSVLGYNYGAGGLMPGGVSQGGTSATPTPPTGGSLSLGSGNSGAGGSNPSGANTGYGSAGNAAAAISAYAAGTGKQSQYGTAAVNGQPPVSTGMQQHSGAITAQPKYNPSGPLAAPAAHYIPAQMQSNPAGQMQGSSQATNNADAWSRMQPQNTVNPPLPPRGINPQPKPGPPIHGGKPPTGPPSNPVPPQPPVYKPPAPPNPPPYPKPVGEPYPKPKPPGKPPTKGKPAPPPSALDKWLAGDTTYQQQLAEYNQEQQAYAQNYTNTGDQISQNFNATQRSMNNQASLDRMNQQYDFAGRGVLSSGAYAQALDQYNTQFQNNMANLVTGENQQSTTNQTNYNNFLRQLVLQRNAAKQDAIARRAAQLGITS